MNTIERITGGGLIAAGLFVLVFCGQGLRAEEGGNGKTRARKHFADKYDQVYDRQRYNKADKNGDGVLSLEEWNNELKNREQQGGRWDFAKADANGDGVVDLAEARAAKQAMRKPTGEALYNAWKKKHADLPAKERFSNFAKSHPEVAEKLLADRTWLENHPKVVKAIVDNKQYLAHHPKLRKAIYTNRSYLDNHPKVAKSIYSDRKWFDNHPGIAKAAYKHRQELNAHSGKTKALHRAAKKHNIARQKAVTHKKKVKKAIRKKYKSN